MLKYLSDLKILFLRLKFLSTLEIIEKFTVYRGFYELSFWNIFPFDTKTLELELYRIKLFLEENIVNNANFEVEVQIRYNENKAFLKILKGKNMNRKIFNFIIPYDKREKYIDFIQAINNIVEEEGIVQLFVNNNPYNLESILYVQTQKVDEVSSIAKSYNCISTENPKELLIFLNEMKIRTWNTSSIPLRCTNNEIQKIISSLYFFGSKKEIEKKGYKKSNDENNKLFISYSHKDKNKVQILEDKLRESGIPFWLDKYEISFGKSLNEEISKAMKEANIFILCLSENCIDGNYIRHEIDTIINNIFIKKEKTNKIAIPLKLDNVNLNQIYMGLENYKYCDYSNKEDMNQMLNMIKREISKI